MKLIPFAVIILFFCSCKRINRSGLSENERNYSKIKTRISTTKLLPSDALFELEDKDRETLFHSVFALTDSVFGKDFETELKGTDIIEELHKHFFESMEDFTSKKVLLDTRNLNDQAESYFQSNSITPVRNFDNFLEYNDEYVFETSIDDYDLTYKIELLLSPDWERIGKFKSVANDENGKTVLPQSAYQQAMFMVINLTAKNDETGQTEYYQKVVKNASVTYSVMNFTDAEYLMDHLK